MLMVDGGQGCVFGREGLEGLQAMAVGCPLLESVSLDLTVDGIHYLATHCPNLKECMPGNKLEKFVCDDLQTLYPQVEWVIITII